MGEQGLNRILRSCIDSLNFVNLNFSANYIGMDTLSSLGQMKNLTHIYLGNMEQYIKNSNLMGLKQMFRKFQSRPQVVKIYEADL